MNEIKERIIELKEIEENTRYKLNNGFIDNSERGKLKTTLEQVVLNLGIAMSIFKNDIIYYKKSIGE